MAYKNKNKSIKTKTSENKFDVESFQLNKLFDFFKKSTEEKVKILKDQELNGSYASDKAWNAAKFIELPNNFVTGKRFLGSNVLSVFEHNKRSDVVGMSYTTLNEVVKIFSKYKDYIPDQYWNNDKRNLTGNFLKSHIKSKLEDPITIFFASKNEFVKSVKKDEIKLLSDEEKLSLREQVFEKKGKEIRYYELPISAERYNQELKMVNGDYKELAKKGYKFKKGNMRYYNEYNIDCVLEYMPEQFFEEFPKLKNVLKFKDLYIPREVQESYLADVTELIKNAVKEELGVVFEEKNVDAAFYSYSENSKGEVSNRKITTCKREQFTSDLCYFTTVIHECSHSTKHSNDNSTYNRKYIKFESYAEEELVAELSTTIILKQFNIDVYSDAAHMIYLENWLNQCTKNEDEAKEIFKNVLLDASKAVSILNECVTNYCLKHEINFEEKYGEEARLKIAEEVLSQRELSLKNEEKLNKKNKNKLTM